MVKYTLTFFEWSVSIVRKKMVKVTFENGTEIMVEPETRVIDAIRLANIKTTKNDANHSNTNIIISANELITKLIHSQQRLQHNFMLLGRLPLSYSPS